MERLPGAAPLHAADCDPKLQQLAARHACVAASPVRGSRGETLAVILLGGEAPVRPRSLAALEASARRLGPPLGMAFGLEQLDAEACRLDRLAALGGLAAEVAHEIRNPLVSVKTFLQLLPERRDDPEFIDHFGSVVADELRRMERLLDLMIEHGRPTDTTQPGSPTEAVAAVAELLRQRASRGGVRLETQADPSAPRTALGDDELRQVVLNLTQNALAATPSGGSVRVEVSASDAGLLLTVSDEGPGIPARLRDAIFEPFVSARADRRGGLGLAITRRLVEQAGGSIGFADRPGGGTAFRVRLPASASSVRPGAAPATSPPGD